MMPSVSFLKNIITALFYSNYNKQRISRRPSSNFSNNHGNTASCSGTLSPLYKVGSDATGLYATEIMAVFTVGGGSSGDTVKNPEKR